MATNLIDEFGLNSLIKSKHNEIKKLYLNDKRPWVIGYSGGKDSTTVVQLVFSALRELVDENGPEIMHKPVFVVSSDTLVENPLIIDYINKNIERLNIASKSHKLDLSASPCKAAYEDSFWTLLIGKGYPSPRQKFRWCTDRLKIRPIDRFILDKIDKHGEVIVVLGVRSQESSSRASTIENHKIENRLLSKHATLNNAFVYSPISDFHLDDVWGYLLNVENPWGSRNVDLFSLYKDSNEDSGECPLQHDKNMPSCGNSRFGCWTCTVVKEDKSLTGFIKNGHKELLPLLHFRDYLFNIRDNAEKRQTHRMNGSIYYLKNADGSRKQGVGPFTLQARKEILTELLTTEIKAREIATRIGKDTNINLITRDELELIRKHWVENGDWEDSLPKLYKELTGLDFSKFFDEREIFQIEDRQRLAKICDAQHIDLEIIKELIRIENKHAGLKRRTQIIKDIEKLFKKDWLHEEIIESMEDIKDGLTYEN